MKYVYECDDAHCGEQIFLDRSIERRNDPVSPCVKCGSPMVRVFTPPYITTEPWHLKDENKRGIAIADARRKEREQRYEADYCRPMPSLD